MTRHQLQSLIRGAGACCPSSFASARTVTNPGGTGKCRTATEAANGRIASLRCVAQSSRRRLRAAPYFPKTSTLGFEMTLLRPCPGGRTESSPAFQRWVQVLRRASPGGTAERGACSTVPSGLKPSYCDPSVETLGYSRPSLRDELAQFLSASGVPELLCE